MMAVDAGADVETIPLLEPPVALGQHSHAAADHVSRTRPAELIAGTYRLSAPIGAGGMAAVHLGVREDEPQTVYAIKRLHPHLAADEYFAKMLLDEAAIAARVRHENVVAMHGATTVDESLVLVMEYVVGVSLAEVIMAVQPGALPPRIATAIIVNILHGLHAAHEASSEDGEPLGIIHRDISPSNVHVGVDGVGRVLDFGIAKAAQRLQVTRAGEIKGQIAYMAPEQIHGRNLDRRIDIRAAGIVLWEALTGKPLFHEDSEAMTLRRVLMGATTPPSAMVLGVPPELDAVVMRALATAPEARFATALAMAEALENVYGERSATPAEVGAWLAVMAAPVLRERWDLRKRFIELPASEAVEVTKIVSRPDLAWRSPAKPAPAERADEPLVWLSITVGVIVALVLVGAIYLVLCRTE